MVADGLEMDEQVEAAWREFRVRLADRLADLHVDDVVPIQVQVAVDDDELERAAPYLQVLRWGADMLRAEAVSNVYLDERYALDATAEGRLLDMGWEPPSLDEHGEPVPGDANHHLDVQVRQVDRVAVLVVRALREVYGCPHPAFVLGWPADGVDELEAQLPAAGAQEAVDPEDTEHLQRMVDEAMRVMLGDRLRHDDEGDIPVPAGLSALFVRVVDDRPAVDVFAHVVCDAEDVDRLPVEADLLNRHAEFGRFVVEGDSIVLRARLCALPFVAQQLRIVVAVLQDRLDEIARDLAARVRGRRFLELPKSVAPPPGPAPRRPPDPRLSIVLELLHEGAVPIRCVAEAFDGERLGLIAAIVAVRTGRVDLDGHREELVLTCLRRALRLVVDGRAEIVPHRRSATASSQQASLLSAGELGEDALDLDWSV